jgi:hypothetical protein
MKEKTQKIFLFLKKEKWKKTSNLKGNKKYNSSSWINNNKKKKSSRKKKKRIKIQTSSSTI